ncbi:MAG: leucine-rich repeat domain-containing protein [Lachnospiraceae bacterium]|nr:leucine-rich repeat domain-containing protein [Lachnospiraceae bacterium]
MERYQKKRMARVMVVVLSCMMGFLFGLGNGLVARAQEISFPFTPEGNFICDANGIITAYNGNKEVDEVIVIPQTISSVSVRGLGDNVFAGCEKLHTIILPETVTSIGSYAFNGCKVLSTMEVYNSEELNDSNGVTFAQYRSGIITLPANLNALGEGAFLTCKSIGRFAVAKSNGMFKAADVSGAESEGDYNEGEMLLSKNGGILYRFAAGFHYTGQGLYPLPEGLAVIGNYALEAVGLNGGFTIPSTVTTIGSYAFHECGNLNTVTFTEPSVVSVIGDYAFAKNSNLNITLPASVTTLGIYTFAYCSNIQIDISKTQIAKLPEYVFYECDNLHTLTTPVTLKSIEAYAFYGCNNFNNIYFLGETLDKIGTGAFQTCNNLHEIVIPSGVTSIENDTFDGCQNLNKIILPDTVTTIGDNAFKDCQNIHEMVIPPSVKYISNSSFTGANQENIDTSQNEYSQKFIKGKLPLKGETFIVGDLKYKVIKSSEKNGTVSVCGVNSKKLKSAVIGATVIYKGYTFKVTEIAANAFKKCTKMTKITVGSNVTKIGKNAFNGAKKLKRITIKSTKLKSVGKNALKGISKKAVVKVPKKKYKKYKKLFKSSTGFKKTMKIKK